MERSGLVKRGYLDLPWGQVHYRTAAADESLPVLLLLHQSPLSSRNYARLLPLLAGSCRPFALDTPGYGASDPAAGVWEVADYADAVLAVADRLGAARFHLFARATGTIFAMAAALKAPGRIGALVLHGLAAYTDAQRASRLAGFAPPYPLAPDGTHLSWIWNRVRGEYPWIGPELATQFVRDYLDAGPDFATAYRAIWRHDLKPALAAGLRVPTLLIAGTADRIFEMHARARALLPAAEAVTLDGATDFVAQQEPERFARCVLDFLAKHPLGA